jgi:hypothetical protein
MKGSEDKSANFASLSNNEASKFCRNKIDSRRWWVIIPKGRAGNDLVQAFERQFYSDANSIGFEVMVLPLGMLCEDWTGAVTVAFALKQYCSPSSLAQWLTQQGRPATRETLAGQNLHFWC